MTIKPLDGPRGNHYTLRGDGAPLTFSDALRAWRDDEAFRADFLSLLADAPFSAYRWETPPLTPATTDRPFEFVLLDAPGLARAPEPGAFADHFRSAPRGASVVTFPNLGRDAVLVVPLPAADDDVYAHLASFVRGAPAAQQHELLRSVSAAVESRLGPRPLWLSTAGAGVAWLHVRLDDRPKYYGHRAYTAAPS